MRFDFGVYGKTIIYIALTASVFGMLGLAQAQEKTGNDQSQVMDAESNKSAVDPGEAVRDAINRERERIHQRIEIIRMWSLVSELNLDESTAKNFFPVVNEIRERKIKLSNQINVLKKRLVIAASKPDADEKEIGELIAEYRTRMSELSKLGDEEFERLSKILNPIQQVQYIIFGDRFHRDLQVIIRQALTQTEKNQPDKSAAGQESPPPQDKSPQVQGKSVENPK